MLRIITDNTLGATLFAMALAGLTFLAYWEPLGFRKLHNYLMAGLFVVWVFDFTYEMGFLAGKAQMGPYLQYEKIELALQAGKSDFGSLSLLFAAVIFYLAFLRGLGSLIGRAPKEGGIFVGVVSAEQRNETAATVEIEK
jgi:hypothetical protein